MGLAAPAFLLLLATLPLVWLLHGRKRRVQTVGSLQLWRKIALNSGGAKASWQRPKISVAMLLQMGVIVALALALAGPFWMRNDDPEHWVFVLDASASMQTRTGEGSRFDLAIARLRDLAGAADPRAVPRLSLITVGGEPHLHAARLENRPGVLDGHWRGLEAMSGGADWEAAAGLVRQVIRPEEKTRAILLTDGDEAGPLALAELSSLAVSTMRLGKEVANAGLVARLSEPDQTSSQTAMAVLEGEVLLAGLERTALSVEYLAEGQAEPLLWRTLEIRSRAIAGGLGSSDAQSVPFSVDLDLPGPGLISVHLPQDAAEFDNSAYFRVLAQGEPFDVLYLGQGNQPLLTALQAIEGIAIYEADGLPQDLQRYRLVVADGVELEREPDTNLLLIGSARIRGEPMPVIFEPGAPSHWDFEAPLARGIDLGAIRVVEASRHVAANGWTALLEAGSDPLLLVHETGAGRQVRLAFDPAQSDWPNSTDFPVFAGNLVRWLGAMPGERLPEPCRLDQVCPVPSELVAGQIEGLLDLGDGSAGPLAEGLRQGTDGAHGFLPGEAGFYRITKGSRSHLVAVGGAQPEESQHVSAPMAAVSGDPPNGTVWHASQWLLLLATGLFVIEAVVAAWGANTRHILGRLVTSPMAGLNQAAKLGLQLLVPVMIGLALSNMPVPLHTRSANLVAVAPHRGAEIPPAGETALGFVRIGAEPAVVGDLGTSVEAGAAPSSPVANIEAALDLAAAMLPADMPGRIVLVPPRRETLGSIEAALPQLRARGIAVDVLTAASEPADEVALLDLDTSGRVFAGDSLPISALAFSDAARLATLRISRGGEIAAEEQIALAPGYNRIETALLDAVEGNAEIGLDLDVPDLVPDNNGRTLAAAVEPKPRLLVLTPQLDQGAVLASILEARDLDVEVVEASRAPWRLSQYLQYDTLILANVPAIDLDTGQQLLIEDAVSRHGRGLLILGGENSFGPGGYLQTPLERISPLSSKVPRDAPEAALVFVLDRSGSMNQKAGGLTRLDIAKQATSAAIKLLGEGSKVAIVVFDSEAQVPLPIQSAADAAAIDAALGRIDPGGGTAIFPGLAEGLAQLRDIEAPARHIVLMTDGLSTPGDVTSLMQAIGAEGITVSAVAIGEGADVTALRQIAGLGGGAFHATTDFQALPSILSQEAMLLSGSPLEEGVTQPRWTANPSPGLAPVVGPLPPITGFVLTTAKPEADLSITVPDSRGDAMPLLASWRYGNGQVLALATHGSGRWTQAWLDSPAYARLLSQSVRNFLPASHSSGLVVALDRHRDEGRVRVDALDDEGGPQALAAPGAVLRFRSPSGETVERLLPLIAVSAGLYEARFDASALGRYQVTVAAGEDSGTAQMQVDFSDALLPGSDNNRFLALATATGGRILGPNDPLVPDNPGRWILAPAVPFWIVLALLAFLLGLAWRYGLVGRVGRR